METIIGKEFAGKVIPLLEQAKNNINIAVYAWYWYTENIGSEIQKFNNAIINAAKKGVDVKVITNTTKTINVLFENKVKAKEIKTKGSLHAKLIIIDDKIAILGSHNYTMSAFTLNHEVSIKTEEKEVVDRLKIYFNNLWQY